LIKRNNWKRKVPSKETLRNYYVLRITHYVLRITHYAIELWDTIKSTKVKLFFLYHRIEKLDEIAAIFAGVKLHGGTRMLVQKTRNHIRDVKPPEKLLS